MVAKDLGQGKLQGTKVRFTDQFIERGMRNSSAQEQRQS